MIFRTYYRWYHVVLICLFLFAATQAFALDVYVSPTGLPSNTGTLNAPVDLQTALGASLPPGTNIWLRGGVYTGNFYSYLNGSASQPITVRSYSGEVATISDTRNWANGATLEVFGSYTTFRDLIITNTGTDRTGPGPSSAPFRPMGIELQGPNIKVINVIIHDTGHGLGMWSNAPNAEVYGNIIYNCGTQNTPGVSNVNGHGMYIQNDSGQKLIRDNIVFDQFGWGIMIYPNPGGIKNITLDGNVVFDNGLNTESGNLYNQISVSGYAPYVADNIVLSNNLTWDSPSQMYQSVESNANLCMGCYDVLPNGSVTLTGNYAAGGIPSGIFKGWRQVTVTGNTFVSSMGFFLVSKPSNSGTYTWNGNHYYGSNTAGSGSFVFQNRLTNYSDWRKASGFDSSSTWSASNPAAPAIFVRPNAYQPGRGHIVVYNWPLEASVQVNLASILAVGQQYRIVNAQNYFGAPVVSGTYNGGAVTLPMGTVSVTPAVNRSGVEPASPQFSAYVVIGQ